MKIVTKSYTFKLLIFASDSHGGGGGGDTSRAFTAADITDNI